jgi:short-subunit dehydrogenase
MSSMSALQGTALVASYAATKAFNMVLAEGLWEELRTQGVDVLACVAGATRTPTFESSQPADGGSLAKPMGAEQVAEEALAALGRGPSMIPGALNRAAAVVMRALPRARAISIISAATRRMYGGR